MPYNDYKKKKEIYKSNNSKISLIEKPDTKTLYVWKKALKTNNTAQQILFREAWALFRIRSNFVITMKEKFDHGEFMYLVLEYCPGGSIKEMIKEKRKLNKPIREDLVLKFLAQIAMGLKDIHAMRWVHLNITTKNVLISTSETVKIGDFGSVEPMKEGLIVSGTTGTAKFNSPEIYDAQPCSPASDVWSLGVCVYEMLALHKPFKHSHPFQLSKMIRKDPPPPITSRPVNPELNDLMMRMLAKEPRDRPSLEDILQTPCVKEFALQCMPSSDQQSQ
ncbi:MAG: putative serine/threonine-protein kinase Nek3 [Streblomastix strix]|uniref:non-specific serine/threonine protein kinase n=1 Tax=Streblomastix strix TaxID=222440 RepID=A0A5J4WDB4_9EUKA|nr:MAG: putative serine/threonine-protein kinase Nek3 [Streblomastix strix]